MCPVLGAAQDTRTADLLERTTAYVEQFLERFTNMVAEERYVQQTVSPRRRRELVSDFLLVKPQGAADWFQFRDVLEVDGQAVRGRDERILRLFLDPAPTALREAARLAAESTRHSLADVGSLNHPLIVMAFLQQRYRDRFRFSRGRQARELGPDVWLVNFEERDRPTILRSGRDNTDLPASGRFWVEEGTGQIHRTELLLSVNRSAFLTQVETRFAFDETLGAMVPVEMRDWHPLGLDELQGVATYGRFRRFAVQTEEAIPP
jgi:hypothetical protein